MIFDKYGLSNQDQLRKNLETLANEQQNKPFALAETVRRKANEMAALIEEIKGISDGFSALEKDKPPAVEGREEVLSKTSRQSNHDVDFICKISHSDAYLQRMTPNR